MLFCFSFIVFLFETTKSIVKHFVQNKIEQNRIVGAKCISFSLQRKNKNQTNRVRPKNISNPSVPTLFAFRCTVYSCCVPLRGHNVSPEKKTSDASSSTLLSGYSFWLLLFCFVSLKFRHIAHMWRTWTALARDKFSPKKEKKKNTMQFISKPTPHRIFKKSGQTFYSFCAQRAAQPSNNIHKFSEMHFPTPNVWVEVCVCVHCVVSASHTRRTISYAFAYTMHNAQCTCVKVDHFVGWFYFANYSIFFSSSIVFTIHTEKKKWNTNCSFTRNAKRIDLTSQPVKSIVAVCEWQTTECTTLPLYSRRFIYSISRNAILSLCRRRMNEMKWNLVRIKWWS